MVPHEQILLARILIGFAVFLSWPLLAVPAHHREIADSP